MSKNISFDRILSVATDIALDDCLYDVLPLITCDGFDLDLKWRAASEHDIRMYGIVIDRACRQLGVGEPKKPVSA